MAKNSPALSNFNAGELSPDFAARVDNEKYAVGSATLQNFIPRVQGGARRRAGSRMVQFVKNSANRTWLRRFVFSQGQAYQLEFGVNYIRFYTNHGQVLSGAVPYEVATPYTAAMLTNVDGTCGLVMQQSGDVIYIACGSYWPMTLTRLAPTNWVLAAYAPPDGPFLDLNVSNTPALYMGAVTGSSTIQPRVNCQATAAVFDPSDVATATTPGRLVRVDVQWFNLPPWTQQTAYATGDLTRFNGNTYKALNSATSGTSAPIHTFGVAIDGKAGVQWLYLDSGYGIGQVVSYTSPTQVQLLVSPYGGQTGMPNTIQYYNFPAATFASIWAVNAISQANPAIVTTSATHNVQVGDPVYLTNIGGMTQISEQMFTALAVTATTITLAGVDSTGFSAFTSGGSAIRNASLNWQIGSWGIGSAAFPGSFPSCNAFYADRLFWAGGIRVWGSVTGQYVSHAEDQFSLVTASSAINSIVAAEDVDAITWLSPLLVLLIGTRGGEFGLAPIVSTQPLGPDNVQVTRFSKQRSRSVPPQIIGTSNFYVQQGGKKVFAQDYNFWLQIYESTNQMRLANHIAGYTVTQGLIDAAWHAEPYETLWAVRSDGVLIGYTFDRQDNVTGWHEHAIGGTRAGPAVVECVSVIPAPDGTRDELWMIVNRTIAGKVVRSVEYLEKDFETGDAQNTMCYVDMSAVYKGVPTITVSGLDYLNGETVQVLRDGGGHGSVTVIGGQITLTAPGSVVQVGLACPANLITMDLEGGADVGTAQGKVKRASHLVLRVKNTLGGYVGMAGKRLVLINPDQATTTTLGTPPPLTTGDTPRVSFPGDYGQACQIQIQQPDPFQMEILGIFPIIQVEEPSHP